MSVGAGMVEADRPSWAARPLEGDLVKARIAAWRVAKGEALGAGALFVAWLASLVVGLQWFDVAWALLAAASLCVFGLATRSRVRFMTGRLSAVTAAISGSLLSIVFAFQMDRGAPLDSDPALGMIMLAFVIAGLAAVIEQWLEHGDKGNEHRDVQASVRELHEHVQNGVGADLEQLRAEVQRLHDLLAASWQATVAPAPRPSRTPGRPRPSWLWKR